MKIAIVPLFLLALAEGPVRGQQEAAVLGNPFDTAADIAAGQVTYMSDCAGCHGKDGEGGRGPALDRGLFRRATTDHEVYMLISTGVAGTEMPGFSFSAKQMWQTIAFVRSMGAKKAAALADGDRARGEAIFFGKGACDTCHMIHGRGSRAGPDLSGIGPERSLGQLETALLHPEQLQLQDQRVRVTMRNGQEIIGKRLNEDTFSLQILAADEKLTSLSKQDIAGYEVVHDSSMASYQGRLSATELKDLITYLTSLGR